MNNKAIEDNKTTKITDNRLTRLKLVLSFCFAPSAYPVSCSLFLTSADNFLLFFTSEHSLCFYLKPSRYKASNIL